MTSMWHGAIVAGLPLSDSISACAADTATPTAADGANVPPRNQDGNGGPADSDGNNGSTSNDANTPPPANGDHPSYMPPLPLPSEQSNSNAGTNGAYDNGGSESDGSSGSRHRRSSSSSSSSSSSNSSSNGEDADDNLGDNHWTSTEPWLGLIDLRNPPSGLGGGGGGDGDGRPDVWYKELWWGKVPNTFWEINKVFSLETTAHGFKDIYIGSTVRRMLWWIFVMASLGITFYLSAQIIAEYNEKPVTLTTLTHRYPILPMCHGI